MQLSAACLALFDQLPDVVFFCKDVQGRYTHANRALIDRLGLSRLEQLLGKTAIEVFPEPLGRIYWEQDQRVVRTGQSVVNELERHVFPGRPGAEPRPEGRRPPRGPGEAWVGGSIRPAGWCLTVKHALTDGVRICGVAGISRDLKSPSTQHPVYQRLANSLQHARAHCTDPLTVQALARHAGLSVAQLERHMAALLHLTPSRWLLSLRLDKAIQQLEDDRAIAQIAADCGFADHSAFTRAFRRHVGLSPSAYRQLRLRS